MDSILPFLGGIGYLLSGNNTKPDIYNPSPISNNELSNTPNIYDSELPIYYGNAKVGSEPSPSFVIKTKKNYPQVSSSFNVEPFDEGIGMGIDVKSINNTLNNDDPNIYDGQIKRSSSKILNTITPIITAEPDNIKSTDVFQNKYLKQVPDFTNRVYQSAKDVFPSEKIGQLSELPKNYLGKVRDKIPSIDDLRKFNKQTDVYKTPNFIGGVKFNKTFLKHDEYKKKFNQFVYPDKLMSVFEKQLKEIPNFNINRKNLIDMSGWTFGKSKSKEYNTDVIFQNKKSHMDGFDVSFANKQKQKQIYDTTETEYQINPTHRSINNITLFDSLVSKSRNYNKTFNENPVETRTSIRQDFQSPFQLNGKDSSFRISTKDFGEINRNVKKTFEFQQNYGKRGVVGNSTIRNLGFETKKLKMEIKNPYNPADDQSRASGTTRFSYDIGENSKLDNSTY